MGLVSPTRELWAMAGPPQPAPDGWGSGCKEGPWRQCVLTTPLGRFSEKRKGDDGLKFEGEGFFLSVLGRTQMFFGWKKNLRYDKKIKSKRKA